MPEYKHLQLSPAQGTSGPAVVVRLIDSKLLKPELIFALRDELLSVVDEGNKKLVLDFAAVESFSSETLNSLLLLSDKVTKAGGQLRLCNIRPLVQSVFEITRLTAKFTIKPTEAEALADL
ncbi:STAS domain-containing protein [Anatilimnocola floriformis]|uniref:STAS domain-containing protein n=1 Tax=Anatilimnocola floriformis TaxID=2948575 RepID=UPI0020C4824B|nr:STAS domain-containing protein [Anatilimnocola floriformis]